MKSHESCDHRDRSHGKEFRKCKAPILRDVQKITNTSQGYRISGPPLGIIVSNQSSLVFRSHVFLFSPE